jgi:uncharacterized protein YfaS (alpha-2-macroglobulin family)
MRILLRFALILIAILWVVGLGYYAYILGTDTLSFPFTGQEKQQGNHLQFVLAKPSFLTESYGEQVIDTSALLRSIRLNDRTYVPTVSGESSLVVSGEYVDIEVSTASGDRLRIDSDHYNDLKKTKFRLPRDLELVQSDIPHAIEIALNGEPRDRKYDVRMYGFPSLDADDIRWYVHNDPKKNCDIADVWNSLMFNELHATKIVSHRVGQMENATYQLDYDVNPSRTCIIAWVGGEFVTVVDRHLEAFSATGGAVDILSPEYDMKSRIDIWFSENIFTDSGTLYSPEYIEHRKQAKIQFLKSLDIVPNIGLTEENIILTPDHASIVANFEEGKRYSIRVKDIMDIYGRKTYWSTDFTPIRSPFLSVGIDKGKTIFRVGEAMPAKIYALDAPKSEYDLKLCRVSLDAYARLERMIGEGKREYTSSLYELLSSSETSSCIKKTIVIASWATASPFDIRELQPGLMMKPGLYVLAFRNKDDILPFDRFVAPKVFSVIDTHITMKIDAGGQMSFLATDILTGRPRENQSITVAQNITRTYTEEWDPETEKYRVNYLPLSRLSFSTWIFLGQTDARGFMATKKDKISDDDYNSPYSLSQEYMYDYEGRYSSFIATSGDGEHFGYVVSTWNDGITGWNFWMKDSDYSWNTRPEFSAYIHTDRRLYLPWEKVYIHAVIRRNASKLEIPQGEKFDITVTDPIGLEIKKITQIPNEYGTIFFDLDLDKNASLGSYTVNIARSNDSIGYIAGGYTNFQVEVFKNPTFTADVSLASPDVDSGVLTNLRKIENTDPSNPWYTSVYQSKFALEWTVKAHYYNGAEIRGTSFTYRIYRNQHYGDEYWSDCFWGCYYEPSPEFYTEGTGTIDQDGLGFFRIPVDFSSFYSDYMYTAEVTITDPMTGEQVVTPATLLVAMPAEYKEYAYDNPINFTPQKKILQPREKISWVLAPQYGKWDSSLKGKYQYELIHRRYEKTYIDDLRLSRTAIPVSFDDVITHGDITDISLILETKDLPAWEYHLRVFPKTENRASLPETATSDTLLYIAGTYVNGESQLRVIPEKTVYHMGETARVMIVTPFTGGYVYLTRERGWVIDYEYATLTGNTLVRDYLVDDTAVPNVYIGAVAFAPTSYSGGRMYAVGYGEIVTDLNDKKWKIDILPNKQTYSNREVAQVDMNFTDRSGKPLEGEIAVMVVDESLIRLLGNIDLDILPKFYQKFPFTMKTSLTAIGIERNRFLSRKGSNGGSGDKWGGGVEISSRTLFKNTAYFNPSVRTNSSGRANFSFLLPDNVTDYRVIAIGQTKDSKFAITEKTLQVRRDYTLEIHVPTIAYVGDSFTLTASAFNATKKITNTLIHLTIGTGSTLIDQEKSLILGVAESKSQDFVVKVPEGWKGDIPYTITLVDNGKILDSVTKTLRIPEIPLLESVDRQFGILTSTMTTITLNTPSWIDLDTSHVVVRVASSLLLNPANVLSSLLQYPYGCIEQTIASTLPNALAIKYASLLGEQIDSVTAQKNLNEWIAKILRMQLYGGWKYWESDSEIHPYVTPYVVRSLFTFRDLGVDIPQASLDAWIQYVADMTIHRSDLFVADPDFRAEVFMTLARAHHDIISEFQKKIDPTKLSRHGYLSYIYGLHYLGKVTPEQEGYLAKLMAQKQVSSYWYWSDRSDEALYAQFLLDRGKLESATKVLDTLVREQDLSSYYISTQERLQILLALMKQTTQIQRVDTSVALRGGTLIADLSLSLSQVSQNIDVTRKKLGNSIEITRDLNSMPLFYEILERNTPAQIFDMPAKAQGNIQVSRTFEHIDISKWVDQYWNYIASESVTWSIFKKGELYRVTLNVNIPDYTNRSWYYLTLEDFVPGWWRPIRWIFKTESIFTGDSSNYWYNSWSHVETKDDRILATSQYGYGDNHTYTYYVRPEYVGIFLLPPVTSYFMYRPEVFAYGKYQKVTVQ